MRKFQYLMIISAIILILSLLTSCQSSQENTDPSLPSEQDNQSTADQLPTKETPIETDEESGLGDETDGEKEEPDAEEKTSTEDSEEIIEEPKRYQVNTKNYMISPVSEQDGEEEKVVLLTFDDTPTGKATYQILDILDKYNAKALFFVNGHYAKDNLETLIEIRDRGHLIGNHTWWHIYIRKENPETVREEIVRLSDFLEEHLGERPKYFRPPFGQNSDVSLEIIKEEGMQTMNWSNGSLDWEYKTPEPIIEQVMSNIKNGDNILFHDKQTTADALDEILSQLTEQGYSFVLPTEVVFPED
jgi:peptidoglycan/xylan/chitin deacetylase (PgdA/CDA1 family)